MQGVAGRVCKHEGSQKQPHDANPAAKCQAGATPQNPVANLWCPLPFFSTKQLTPRPQGKRQSKQQLEHVEVRATWGQGMSQERRVPSPIGTVHATLSQDRACYDADPFITFIES